MRWPWSRTEKRQASPLDDQMVQALLSKSTTRPDATAALEAAAGAYSRAFAVAEVDEAGPWRSALSAALLGSVGRGLIRAGEVVYRIDVEDGVPSLIPASSWQVRGGPDPGSWRYHLTEEGPTRTRTRVAASDEVVHFVYAHDPARPWQGRSPLSYASGTSDLLAEIERALADEVKGPRGSLVPIPEGGVAQTDEDQGTSELDVLSTKIARLDGGLMLVESGVGGWGDPAAGTRSGAADLSPRRVGANPPASTVSLRSEAAVAVLAACGVPPSIIEGADASGQREGLRRFLHGSVSPLGELVAVELRRKLERPDLALGFRRLYAADLQGRARAVQSLTGAGLALAEARQIAGLDE